MPVRFGASAEPLVVIDDAGTVVHWNDAAARLLGREAAEAVGRPCHEVLQGLTPSGAHLCGPSCPIAESCRRLRAPRRFEMVVRHPKGQEIWLEVTTCVVLDEDDRAYAVHVLAESVVERHLTTIAESVVRRMSSASREQGCTLEADQMPTRRELDVLAQLAQGTPTAEIARRLQLAPATVRNHIQNLLMKLGAHSRAEAVVLGLKTGLVHLP